MSLDVLCLRPRIDFERANALPAAELAVAYHAPNDAEVIALMKQAHVLVIPAVGPKLNPEIFANTAVKLVQVTGAGLDRLDLPLLKSMGIAVAAYLLQLSSAMQGHDSIVAADFPPTFIVIALLSLVAPLLHRRLPSDAGVAVSGHGVK